MADRIEAGTFCVAATLAKGNLEIKDFNSSMIRSELELLTKAGAKIKEKDADIFNMDTGTVLEEGNSNFWSGSNLLYYEVLSGSDQVFSSSISGSIGDGFAYGIKDSSGQHTPYLFPVSYTHLRAHET